MAEKPIIFSTEMVRAILEGRKTQTRRVCKEIVLCDFEWGLDREPYIGNYRTFTKVAKEKREWVTLENVWLYNIQTKVDDYKTYLLKPKYQPGDVLWVREAWCKNENPNSPNYGGYEYYADYEGAHCQILIKWRSPIHMPRKVARIFLKVKNIRVERLQAITEQDAVAEGFVSTAKTAGDDYTGLFARDQFAEYWDKLHAKRGYSWDQNPWVWVIEFEKVEPEI